MANYYRNELIIHGPSQLLVEFQQDARPQRHERCDDSWGGHGTGAFSFLSLLPPPYELRGTEAERDDVWKWTGTHWGCCFPELETCILDGDDLYYDILTKGFCAHDFVVNVSRRYPHLDFTLVWWDVQEGEYGFPMNFALLKVRDGAISCDYVEMSEEALLLLVDPSFARCRRLEEGP